MQPSHEPKTISAASTPRVSVIIPCYNHAQYLKEAIQSVLSQTYKDFEIIVVDDGSTDSTRNVAARFGNCVRYIWQENQGLSAARNAGIRAANGELIGLLDADDLYEPDFLSIAISALAAHPEANGLYCVCQTVDIANNLLPEQIGTVVAPDQLYATLLQGGFFPPLCMFVYKYCYEQAGMFDRTFQGCADWDMWLRISKRYTIIGTDRLLARYRIVPTSMSSDPVHMLNDQLAVLQKHFGDEIVQASEWTKTRREVYGRVYLRTGTDYFRQSSEDQARKYLREAFKICPELFENLDVYYELAYSTQPRGFRGDVQTLNIKRMARLLEDTLKAFFDDSEISAKLAAYKSLTFANAYLVLGLLSYRAGEFGYARRFLTSSLVTHPRNGFNTRLLSILAKAMLPVSLVRYLKNRRQTMATSRND